MQIYHWEILKLNKNKCHFRCTKILFSGEVISTEGVWPDPKKLCMLTVNWIYVLKELAFIRRASSLSTLTRLTGVFSSLWGTQDLMPLCFSWTHWLYPQTDGNLATTVNSKHNHMKQYLQWAFQQNTVWSVLSTAWPRLFVPANSFIRTTNNNYKKCYSHADIPYRP